jgi:amidophosphoribosyltransferase
LESGICAALGFAAESGVPYEPCIIKNPNIGRTFITPGQKRRLERISDKHNPVTSLVAGKRLNIIDDSIVRASTAPLLCKVLKKHKAREVHFRIASPPITHPCLYGIDTPTKKELIAADHSQQEIAEIIGADSLKYLSLEGMIAATGMPAKNFCLACFTGEYPV